MPQKLCPSRDCRAANPTQRQATDAERNELKIPDHADAQTCMYCGCIYSRGADQKAYIWKP
jgi:hypothetical protein